jgi:cell division protein FtsN
VISTSRAPAGATPTYSYNTQISSPSYSLAMTGGTGYTAQPTTPLGYRQVWNDGRLNEQRGLPAGTTVAVTTPEPASNYGRLFGSYRPAQATTATTQNTVVSTRQAPQRTAPVAVNTHRYVQVATYGSSDDAQVVAQRLRAQGLPMRIGRYTRNGQTYRIVMAGPFNSANQLSRALGVVRGAGFSNATTRQ